MGFGGEPGHVRAGLGDGVLGGAAAPAGHRLGLLQLLLVRGQQGLDHPGQPGDVLVHLVDAGQHGGQQRGMMIGKELRALHRGLELADLARARARASWASAFGSRSPRMRWSMMSRPVTPCRSVTTLDSLIAADSSSFPVAGVQPDDPELFCGHEARGDGAALEASRQPLRVSRVVLGAAGQVLHLLGVGQHALEALGLQPVKRPLPNSPALSEVFKI